MSKKEHGIVEKWQRSCVLIHVCRDCADRVVCLKLSTQLEQLPFLWEKEKK